MILHPHSLYLYNTESYLHMLLWLLTKNPNLLCVCGTKRLIRSWHTILAMLTHKVFSKTGYSPKDKTCSTITHECYAATRQWQLSTNIVSV